MRDVLIVDDEPLIRMMAADALAERGIISWEASDANEALHVLEQHPSIGLLFTDVNMPGEMDGLGLAHEIRNRRADVTLVVTSGADSLSVEELPAGASFLRKPYLRERLVSIITQRLDHPS